ncbi:hypothetical protein D4R42_03195 [bacterium]|nr:MAG: hypothetical protein D4R42_03195 [bacterium]
MRQQRINPRFLRAGLGYGGACFPKEVKPLIVFSNRVDYTHPSYSKQSKKLTELKEKKNRRSRSSLQTRHRRHARSRLNTYYKPTP